MVACEKCKSQAYLRETTFGGRWVRELHCVMCGWVKALAVQAGETMEPPLSLSEAHNRVGLEREHPRGHLTRPYRNKRVQQAMKERLEDGDSMKNIARDYEVSIETIRRSVGRGGKRPADPKIERVGL